MKKYLTVEKIFFFVLNVFNTPKKKVREVLCKQLYEFFYFPYLHKGRIAIEKKSSSEIFSEFHVSDYVDSEK